MKLLTFALALHLDGSASNAPVRLEPAPYRQPRPSQQSMQRSPQQSPKPSPTTHTTPAQNTVSLRAGLVITKSVRIAKRAYSLPAKPSVDSAVIIIRGDNITVDFNGAELRGTPTTALPDEAAGVAIRVEGGRNVQLLNVRVRGYRVGILAVGTRGLKLTNNDLSHNWKPRLFSLVEHESLVDWMSYHKNEKREWLRFGAGIYLEDVVGGEISGNRVEQSINGLMLTRSDSLQIHSNAFSYNSALGIALYRSSHNVIYQNTVDYNVRGYSHGFFRRGQDSAGLLMYEQSSHNVVAWNSVTHGGDGLFLWAGQTTMDTGAGGANDNLYYANDFSFAPTNGIEATFSRNDFIGNRVEGSDHGVWGGYSFNSRIVGNCFSRNRIAIAIEHGQDNAIIRNHFDGDSLGISLWGDSIAPSDWGYPKHRDTRSRDYRINRNTFETTGAALKIVNTIVADTSENLFGRQPLPSSCKPDALIPTDVMASIAGRLPRPKSLTGTVLRAVGVSENAVADSWNRFMPASFVALRKRDAIVVDEWGPFDWRSPKLWPIDSTRAPKLRLRVLGPPGSWRIVGRRGVTSVSKESGVVGDTITVTPAVTPGETVAHNWSVTLEYRGEATVSPRGIARAKGAPVPFSYEVFRPRTDWRVSFFRWDDSSDPRKDSTAFARLLQGTPLLSRTESRLDYFWSRPNIKDVPASKFALVATTSLTVPVGEFTLRTISDDAIRVWVDGRKIIDNWTPHESAVDNARIAPGKHDVRVEYAQVDGWVEMRLEIVKGRTRSTGSPGPH